jgi:ATP-dependent DNA helicase RecG
MNEISVTEEMLRNGESSRVEFIAPKQSKDAIARSVCAMLNSKGGTILVGVDNHGQVVDQVSECDANEVRTFLHESITPHVLFTVTLDDTQSGPIISVDVPAGSDSPYVYNGAIYIRSGARTKPADANMMREMVERRARETERWEKRIASELSVNDLDRGLLNETVRRAQQRRGYQFDNTSDLESVLTDLSLSRFGQLTNAADVLFGQRVMLRHPQTRLRAVCYKTDRGNNFIDEQLFEGPAFKLLEQAMAFLKRHVSIATEFKEGQLSRESRPQYPFNSLREGLVNALVHRDYVAFSGGVSVSIYPGRVEIWNSGHLAEGLTPKKLQTATHDSILVNPDICHVFYLHELMERVGRGTFKIVQECRELGMKPPTWKNAKPGVRLTLYAALGQSGVPIQTNERQAALLQALAPDESIRLREFLERFGRELSDRQARRDIRELVNAGYLVQVGSGPATEYKRTNKTL